MNPTLDYAMMAMGLFIATGMVFAYIPSYWWVSVITVPFGGLFSLGVLDRLSSGK